MATNDAAANIRIGADDSSFRASLRGLLGQMNDFGKDAKTHLDGGVGGAVDNLRSKFVALGAFLGTGAIVNHLRQIINEQDELSKGAQKVGMATEQWSAYTYAAGLAGVQTEQLGKAFGKLSNLMADVQAGDKRATSLLKSLGLEDAQTADQLMLGLAQRFQGMADGATKVALASELFGERIGPGLIPFLNQGKDGIEALMQEAQQLGVVLDTETGRAAEAFNDNLTRLATASKGALSAISAQLLPTLNTLTGALVESSKEGGVAAQVGRGLDAVLRMLAVTAMGVGYSFKSMGRELGAGLAMLEAASNFDVAGLQAIGASLDAQRKADKRGFVDLGRDVWSGPQPADTYPDEAARGSRTPGALDWTPPSKAGGRAGGSASASSAVPTSYMATYELALAEEKRVQALLTEGREFTKQQELEYWRALQEAYIMTSNDRVAIARKTAGLEVDIARQSAQQRAAVEAEVAQTTQALELGKVTAQQEAARRLLDSGAITRTQLLLMERDFETQRTTIQLAALEERRRLLESDPSTNPAELARVQGQMLLLEQEHQRSLAALQEANPLTTYLGNLEAGFSGALNGMLFQAQTWQQAMGGLFSGLGMTFVQEAVTKPFAAWVAGQARMLAMKFGFIAQEKTADAAGAATTVAIKSAETTAVVTGNAAQAGSGAASAMASIPYVGPVLALAAMAAMVAAVMGLMGGGRKSARGGYDIPANVSPLTQLHEEEMVLPAHLANAVRNMAAGGAGSAAAQPPQAPVPTIEFPIVPMPGGFWMAQQNDFVRFFNTLVRDGALRPGQMR